MNQLRVLLAAAANGLRQELRRQTRKTEFARAQVLRPRGLLLKIVVCEGDVEAGCAAHTLGASAEAEWLAIVRNLGWPIARAKWPKSVWAGLTSKRVTCQSSDSMAMAVNAAVRDSATPCS